MSGISLVTKQHKPSPLASEIFPIWELNFMPSGSKTRACNVRQYLEETAAYRSLRNPHKNIWYYLFFSFNKCFMGSPIVSFASLAVKIMFMVIEYTFSK